MAVVRCHHVHFRVETTAVAAAAAATNGSIFNTAAEVVVVAVVVRAVQPYPVGGEVGQGRGCLGWLNCRDYRKGGDRRGQATLMLLPCDGRVYKKGWRAGRSSLLLQLLLAGGCRHQRSWVSLVRLVSLKCLLHM